MVGARFPVGQTFLFSTASGPNLGPTKLPIQRKPVGSGFYLWLKRLGRASDHSPPSSAEVKNGGTVLNSTIRLRGVMLNEAQGHHLAFSAGTMFRFCTEVASSLSRAPEGA
jgi:hypothetical protein